MKRLNELWTGFSTGRLSREAFFEKLLPSLKSLLRDDDFVQETALRIYQNLDKFGGRSSFGTWVWTIARNVRASAIRREPDGEIVPVEEASMLEDLQDSPQEIIDFLTILGRSDRNLLQLKLSGHTEEAIAASLGIPINTLKSRWMRLKEKLRCS